MNNIPDFRYFNRHLPTIHLAYHWKYPLTDLEGWDPMRMMFEPIEDEL